MPPKNIPLKVGDVSINQNKLRNLLLGFGFVTDFEAVTATQNGVEFLLLQLKVKPGTDTSVSERVMADTEATFGVRPLVEFL